MENYIQKICIFNLKGRGKYKVNLMVKATPSIQEINVNIILAPTGVEFEVDSELV